MESPASSPTPMTLKLLINRKAQKVVFAEAEKPFVDFLLYLMSLPLGTVTKFVTQKSMVGALGNLYGSIADLGDTYMQPGIHKNTFLNPKVSITSSDVPLLMPAASPAGTSVPRKFTYVAPPAKAEVSTTTSGEGGGFVRGVVSYMVMDDLKVMPQSTISAITTLNDSNVTDFGSLEVKVVSLDNNVGLKLLKAALETNSVLTTVFLGKSS
ncbi:hypothetical protein DM860_010734 [Cuscuta australis]|uniref:DUF674 domain-containing protein n=1 Tax=Cuscuta australis TaxID=267555 RepID=A0A328DZT1_9ASTE|nr:hypothetical protein DM860_010734 [Cuscuta australis]